VQPPGVNLDYLSAGAWVEGSPASRRRCHHGRYTALLFSGSRREPAAVARNADCLRAAMPLAPTRRAHGVWRKLQVDSRATRYNDRSAILLRESGMPD